MVAEQLEQLGLSRFLPGGVCGLSEMLGMTALLGGGGVRSPRKRTIVLTNTRLSWLLGTKAPVAIDVRNSAWWRPITMMTRVPRGKCRCRRHDQAVGSVRFWPSIDCHMGNLT
jgi:hypothetical protein